MISYDAIFVSFLICMFVNFLSSFVLWDPAHLIWRQGTQFEATTGYKAFIDGFLAEVFRGTNSNNLLSIIIFLVFGTCSRNVIIFTYFSKNIFLC